MSLKNVLATMKQDTVIVGKVDRWLLSKNRTLDKTYRPTEHIHPSGIYGCGRVALYRNLGIFLDNITPRLSRIFGNGDGMHDRWKGYCKAIHIATDKDIEVEVFDPVRNIKGSVDIIPKVDGVRWIVDFKSMNHDKFEKLKEPEEKDIWQITLYMDITKIPRGLLLYEDKNTQAVKEFKVKLDKEIVSKIDEKIAMIRKHMKKGTLCPRECKPGSYGERFCAYSSFCNSELSPFKTRERILKGMGE